MRRKSLVKLLLAGLLLLLPLPAFADVTAHYAVTGSQETIVIAADDGGNLRADIAGKLSIIRRDGVDYVAVADAGGDMKVTPLADVLAMLAAQLPSDDKRPTLHFTLSAEGGEAVAGYPGMLFKFGPDSPAGEEAGKRLIEVVLSNDPRLAPVGAFFRHLIEVANPVITAGMGAGNFGEVANQLFAQGAPLRIGKAFSLASIDTADIPASQFELPGPVLEPMEFLQAVMPSEGGGLAPLP